VLLRGGGGINRIKRLEKDSGTIFRFLNRRKSYKGGKRSRRSKFRRESQYEKTIIPSMASIILGGGRRSNRKERGLQNFTIRKSDKEKSKMA